MPRGLRDSRGGSEGGGGGDSEGEAARSRQLSRRVSIAIDGGGEAGGFREEEIGRYYY
jgi:hypothetical protein